MKKNHHDWRIAISCGAVLACAACAPADKEVGSACKNGVCPGALATEAPVCLATSLRVAIAVSSAVISRPGQPDVEENPSPALDVICLPRRLATDDAGKVQCDVTWSLKQRQPGDDAPAHCSELPFLEPGEDADTCVLPQLDAHAADASTGDGWYYDEVPNELCLDRGSAIRLTAAARPPSGVVFRLSCVTVQEIGADGEVAPSDGAMCMLPPDSARHKNAVGDSCMPRVVPEGGFSSKTSYIQTGATECGTGACLVYGVEGDPTPGCKEVDAGDTRCADPKAVESNIHCTYRCDEDRSDCPDGFYCEEILQGGPEALRGSYCLRAKYN